MGILDKLLQGINNEDWSSVKEVYFSLGGKIDDLDNPILSESKPQLLKISTPEIDSEEYLEKQYNQDREDGVIPANDDDDEDCEEFEADELDNIEDILFNNKDKSNQNKSLVLPDYLSPINAKPKYDQQSKSNNNDPRIPEDKNYGRKAKLDKAKIRAAGNKWNPNAPDIKAIPSDASLGFVYGEHNRTDRPAYVEVKVKCPGCGRPFQVDKRLAKKFYCNDCIISRGGSGE